jgi:hypothetical protein
LKKLFLYVEKNSKRTIKKGLAKGTVYKVFSGKNFFGWIRRKDFFRYKDNYIIRWR